MVVIRENLQRTKSENTDMLNCVYFFVGWRVEGYLEIKAF